MLKAIKFLGFLSRKKKKFNYIPFMIFLFNIWRAYHYRIFLSCTNFSQISEIHTTHENVLSYLGTYNILNCWF